MLQKKKRTCTGFHMHALFKDTISHTNICPFFANLLKLYAPRIDTLQICKFHKVYHVHKAVRANVKWNPLTTVASLH